MKKFKKLLSMAMILALCIASMTVSVSAADTDISPQNEAVVDVQNNRVKVNGEANYDRVLTGTYAGTTYDEVYLARFDVSSLKSATLTYSTFRPSASRYTSVYAMSNVWNETGINFANIAKDKRLDANKLTVTGSGNSGYTVSHTVELTSEFISEHMEDDGTITLMITVSLPSTAQNATSRVNGAPKLTDVILKTGPTKFSFKKAEGRIQVAENPVYVNSNEPNVNAYNADLTEFALKNYAGTMYGYAIFKFDLSDINKDSVEKFTFDIQFWTNSSSQGYKLSKVTQAWNNGVFMKDETPLYLETFGKTGELNKSFDITSVVKSIEGDELTLIVEPNNETMQATKASLIRWNATGYTNPYIGIKYKAETVSSCDEITSAGTLHVEKTLVEGTADAPITATPILAVYEGDALYNINIGDAVECNGNATNISVDIPVEALSTGDYKVKFFIWNDLSTLVPLFAAKSLN